MVMLLSVTKDSRRDAESLCSFDVINKAPVLWCRTPWAPWRCCRVQSKMCLG